MIVSTIRACTVTLAVLMTLTGCGGDPNQKNQKSVTFNPNIDGFSGQPDGGGFSARTLTCTKEIDGQCMQKTCKQSAKNVVPFDCASYAAACVNAGEHWSGTKEGGTCTRVL